MKFMTEKIFIIEIMIDDQSISVEASGFYIQKNKKDPTSHQLDKSSPSE